MASVGRFFCVALPFALTLLSLIFLLVACLGGVTNKNLYMFQVNTTDLSISPNSIKGLVTRDIVSDVKDLVNGAGSDSVVSGSGGGSNITAADLGLGNYYDVSLWGYCVTDDDGEKECTKAKFDWANGVLNTTILEKIKAATGKKPDIPDEIVKGLDAFATVTKWTEVVYIIALAALAVQLFFGIFATCSRALSCITFIVSGVASVAVLGAAGMSTAMSVVVVGTVESTAKLYGVQGSFNVTFLTLIWLSAAFALGAGFFWLFTICCCAPDHSRRRSKRKSADAEKLLPTGAYQPLNDPEMSHGYYNNSQYGAPRYPSGAPRSDMAYEPYSHKP